MKGFFILIVSLLLSNLLSGQNVNIIILNECGQNDVKKVTHILNKIYRFNITPRGKYTFTKTNNRIDCDNLNLQISGNKIFSYDPKKPINIFVTTIPLITKNNMKVKGVCYGNNIYINSLSKRQMKTTLTHEISHTFGLKHCDGVCIMNIEYNPNSIDLIWNKKTDKPIFCNKCRSSVKNVKMIF